MHRRPEYALDNAYSFECIQVDESIRECFREYLYNEGRGELIPLSDILQVRRNGCLGAPTVDRRSRLDVSSMEVMTDDGSEYNKQNGGLARVGRIKHSSITSRNIFKGSKIKKI